MGRPDPRQQGRPRKRHHLRDRQAPRRSAGRDRVRAGLHVVVRGRGGEDHGHGRPGVGAGKEGVHGEAADWRRGGAGAVEFSYCVSMVYG